MRIGTMAGRIVLGAHGGAVDVEKASGGAFGPDPSAVYERWDAFRRWVATADASEPTPMVVAELGPPSPRPRQVFALALNYRDHAEGTGFAPPAQPSVFTKFPTSHTGPHGDIVLPDGDVDWEVELVVVIGRRAEAVAAEDAWAHVAGVTVGQDLSERRRQFADATPQFSLSKSFPGFAPIGPWLVTPDELDDPDDLELGCLVNGERMQHSRTSHLIFPVPEVIAHLSRVLALLPGDVIFTGTPSGVGGLRTPPRFLQPGDELVTYITGVGRMHHRLVLPS
jgi:2,4-diketo-3-deoxy-L-fuconate hydrolase